MALKVLDGFTSHSLALDVGSSLLMEIISNGLRCYWDHVVGRQPTLQIIVEESKGDLVSPLVFLEDYGVIQVCSCGHPAVDLVGEGLDVFRDLEVGLVFFDVVCILVLGRKHTHGHLNLLCIGWIEHGWMALDGGLELGLLSCYQGGNLTTPAVADDAPAGDV